VIVIVTVAVRVVEKTQDRTARLWVFSATATAIVTATVLSLLREPFLGFHHLVVGRPLAFSTLAASYRRFAV
jgi:hypothetical protein